MKLTNLIPLLETDNLKETIEFYTEKLGFVCESVYPDNGTPCWTNLRKDAVTIMFSLKSPHTTAEKPIMTGSLYLYPDDVDQVWEQLKDKVIVEYPIENFEYGMREFAIRDCNGYIIQFGQGVS
ncbi:MAG: hypothetical protein FD167_3532 [bacterium]|nr:MAG: hypothetical protein FD167_3532 [bacterium]